MFCTGPDVAKLLIVVAVADTGREEGGGGGGGGVATPPLLFLPPLPLSSPPHTFCIGPEAYSNTPLHFLENPVSAPELVIRYSANSQFKCTVTHNVSARTDRKI